MPLKMLPAKHFLLLLKDDNELNFRDLVNLISTDCPLKVFIRISLFPEPGLLAGKTEAVQPQVPGCGMVSLLLSGLLDP